MGNMIRAQLFRLRAHPAGLAAVTGLLTVSVGSLAVESASLASHCAQQILYLLAAVSVAGMFFALYCAGAACSGMNKLGILKNEAVFGISRPLMYLSRLVTALLLGTFLFAVVLGSALLSAFCFCSDRWLIPQYLHTIMPVFAAAFPLWCASAGLLLCLNVVTASDSASSLLAVLFYLVGWPAVGMAVANVYPETAGFVPSLAIALYALHPATPFWNGAMLSDNMPTGFTVTIDLYDPEATLASLPYCWALGLGWLAVTSLIGILVLNRRSLT